MEALRKRPDSGYAIPAGVTLLVAMIYCLFYRDTTPVVPPVGLVCCDKNKREYAGKIRYFESGAEQKIYIDKKPFGSLDSVVTKLFSRNGYNSELEERTPNSEEIDTFLVLEDYGKKEHPWIRCEK